LRARMVNMRLNIAFSLGHPRENRLPDTLKARNNRQDVAHAVHFAINNVP